MKIRIASNSVFGNLQWYCSTGVRVELLEIEIPVTSVGDILSVVLVLIRFGFEKTEVVCV